MAVSSREIRALGWELTPAEAWARWPRGERVVALWSGGGGGSRWTVLGRVAGVAEAWPASVAEAKQFIEAELRAAGVPLSRALDREDVATRTSPWHAGRDAGVPFVGGVVLGLSYGLGRVLEPAVGGTRHREEWPRVLAVRVEDAAIYDHLEGSWWAVGAVPELERRDGLGDHEVTGFGPEGEAAGFEGGVGRVLEYIRAGDVYQVNLAHRLRGRFAGDARGLFAGLMAAARPWYGAYLETDAGVVCSASPELFLSYDPATRRLTTRPMKGTRPAERERELIESEKDAAELNMITDLMRNDIGKVSELGSVRVEAARSVETHNRLVQTTSTVTGTLRGGLTFVDALLSAFPAGSVTGCPKIRAMQIIDELEEGSRGLYCGSIGYVSRSGHAAFNVAIRTAVIRGGELSYHAGAGIVVDSEPGAEWRETLDKAGVLMRVARHANAPH